MTLAYLRFIFLVIFVLFLTILPIPASEEMYRPLFGLLFIVYILFKVPELFSYFWVIVLGLLLDVLGVVPLGEHIFSLCLVVGIASGRARRFKFFSPLQQIMWIFILTLIYQFTKVIIDYLCGHPPHLLRLFVVPIVSTAVWPFFVMFIERYVFFSRTRS